MFAGMTTLMRQARSGDFRAALAAAQHPSATPEILMELAHFGQDDVRRAVAENPQSSADILSLLVYDPSAEVVCAVARHESMPEACYEQLAIRVIADAIMQKGRQRAAILEIGVALASNPKTPFPLIERLLREITNSQFIRILARDATREDVLRLLAQHSKATVRELLAKNPALPLDILQELAGDVQSKVADAAEAALENIGALEDIAEVRAEVLRERYDQLGDACDADRALLMGGEPGLTAVRALCQDAVVNQQPVVDVACDTGAWLACVAESHADVPLVGLDISPVMLEKAKARLGGRADLREANVLQGLPLEKASVGTLLVIDFLQCVTDPAAFFEECRRVLVDGGHFVGVIRCMADDDVDNALYADAAARYHMDIPLRGEAEEMIGTSGLVIERMDTELIPVAAATDPAIVGTLKDATWKAILDEAVGDGAMASSISMGLFCIIGRNVRY